MILNPAPIKMNGISTNRGNLLVGALFCFGLIAALIYQQYLSAQIIPDDQAWIYFTVILLYLGLLLIVGTLALRKAYPDYTLFHPPVLITGSFLFLYGTAGLASLFDPTLLSSLRTTVVFSNQDIVLGWMLITIGLMFLWLGYAIGLGKYRQQDTVPTRPRISLQIVLVLYVITVVLRVMSILIGGIAFGASRSDWGAFGEQFVQTIDYIDNSKYLVIALILVGVFRDRWPKSVFLGIMLIESALAFTSGFSKPLLWIAIVTLLTLVYLKFFRQRRGIALLATICGVVLSILIVPVSEGIRATSTVVNGHSIIDVIQSTGNGFQESWGKGIDAGWAIFTNKMFGRQAGVASMTGIILRETPSVKPYLGLDQLLISPIYIIPRFLFPNKPILSNGVWFSVNYLNMPTNTNTSNAVTYFGEAYIYGGWVGVVIGSICLGLLLAFIVRRTLLLNNFYIYVALIPGAIDIEAQLTTTIIGLIQSFIVLLIIYWLIIRLSNRQIASSLKLAHNL